MRIVLTCGASANVSPDVSQETINALDEMMSTVQKQFTASLPIPTTEDAVAWAEEANTIADVLRALSDQFNGVDNGHCTLCRQFRLYDTRGKVQACENEACLSHAITAILDRYESPSAETLDRIKRNCERVLFGEKHGTKSRS